MSAAEQVYYCRAVLPGYGQWRGSVAATRMVIGEVLIAMEGAGVDPATGQLRVTYDMDSEFLNTYVAAEWRPSK